MKKYMPIAVLVTLVFVAWFGGLKDILTLDNFHEHKGELNRLVMNHYAFSLVCFSLFYIFITMTSIPIASLVTFVGGFLYGVPVAAAIIVCSATIGATGLFLIARSSLGESLRGRASGLYDKVENEMKANAFFYILSLRLMPIFPFFIVNILPALFNVKMRDYVLATALGILPGTIIYTNVGRSLGMVHNPADLISLDFLMAFFLLGALAITPVIIKKYKIRHNGKVTRV